MVRRKPTSSSQSRRSDTPSRLSLPSLPTSRPASQPRRRPSSMLPTTKRSASSVPTVTSSPRTGTRQSVTSPAPRPSPLPSLLTFSSVSPSSPPSSSTMDSRSTRTPSCPSSDASRPIPIRSHVEERSRRSKQQRRSSPNCATGSKEVDGQKRQSSSLAVRRRQVSHRLSLPSSRRINPPSPPSPPPPLLSLLSPTSQRHLPSSLTSQRPSVELTSHSAKLAKPPSHARLSSNAVQTIHGVG